MRARWAGGIAGVLVLGAVAGGWWWWQRAPEGFIIDIVAVDDGSATVLWRLNRDSGHPSEWVAHFDADGNLDWKRELPGLSTSRGMFVIRGLVTVRYSHQDDGKAIDQSVAAYALDDGHLAWDTVLAKETEPKASILLDAPFVVTFSASGALLEQVIERGEHLAHVLYAVEPSSGRVVGRAELHADPEPVAPVVVGDRLVLHGNGDTVNIVDPTHGLVVTDARIAGGGIRIGCVVGDDYIAGEHEQIIAFRRGDPAARRVIAQPFVAASSRRCGHYRDRIVFELVAWSGSTASIAITDRAGNLVATIAMPFSSSWDPDSLSRPPESLAFSGDLPRFVPYLSSDDTKQGDHDRYLAMVDLEQARVAWTASSHLALSDAIFRAGDRWYLNNTISGGELASFDGATGQLVAAIHGGRPVEPRHVAGGRLWLHETTWGRLDKAPLAVVDAKTLEPRFARGVELSDITAQTRTRLGAP